MSKELVISTSPHETRVAILEEGQLCEIYVEREKEYALVGSIYKGRVTRVLPGMQSAFVDIGLDTDAFLYVSDVLEEIEEYDRGAPAAEEKQPRPEPSLPATAAAPSSPGPTIDRTAPPPSGHHGREGRFGRGPERRGRFRRGHRHGRDLPPSKYVSPRTYEPPSSEPSEPVILPGESLAKYKDRLPAPGAERAPAAPPPEPETEQVRGPSPAATEEFSAAAATIANEPYEAAPETPAEESSAAPLTEPHELEQEAAPPASTEEAGVPGRPLAAPSEETELTIEEAADVAEQLAEAREEAELVGTGEAGESAGQQAAELPAETGEAVEAAAETAEESAIGETAGAEAAIEAAGEEPEPFTARVQDPTRAPFQRPMHQRLRHLPRGGRRARHERHMPPRRPHQMISELLKPGQDVIVQITKEPLGKKGARITSHIALPGRFLVYMPTLDHMGISRKIASAETRGRLRRLVQECKGTNPGGFIVRTAAENATDDDIRSDAEYLTRTWADLRGKAEQRKPPALLHRDLNLVERTLRDTFTNEFTSVWVDTEEEYTRVLDFISRFQPELVGRAKLYTKETPIFEEMGIQQDIDKSLRPKVWLKSGGYIVINHTEALVAIDVNTGKFVGRGSTRLEDTIVKTNIEAVKEVVRQIRLRDLGGIIVIDFIDMEERRNREKVLQALEDALRADRAPSKVLPFNEFGLVAITRKRTRQALERVLCQPCPYCTGSGMVKSVPTICYEVQAEARKMAPDLDSPSLTLRVHPEIAKALKTRESGLVEELERAVHKSIIIQADPTLHWEQYDIY
jgi:ribonuclease G